MAASVTMVDISEDEQSKFPDFISSFMPDAVPKVPDDFFYDGSIQQLINTTNNEANAMNSASINIISPELIDEFITSDIVLAAYPNLREINLLLAGLYDITLITSLNNIDTIDDDNNINYIKDRFQEIIDVAREKVTGINDNVASASGKVTGNNTVNKDIVLDDELTYMINKAKEIISIFKTLYNDDIN